VEKRQTAKFCTRVQRLDKLQVREARVRKEKRKKTMKKKRSRKISRDCRASSKRVLVFNERSIEVHDESSEESSDDDGHFGFEPGPIFTLQGFEKYADQFKLEYFGLKEQHEPSSCYTPKDEPSVECIEGEYWRIVEHATEQLEVLIQHKPRM
jgi:histone demethylase JARID1